MGSFGRELAIIMFGKMDQGCDDKVWENGDLHQNFSACQTFLLFMFLRINGACSIVIFAVHHHRASCRTCTWNTIPTLLLSLLLKSMISQHLKCYCLHLSLLCVIKKQIHWSLLNVLFKASSSLSMLWEKLVKIKTCCNYVLPWSYRMPTH